MRNSWSMFFYFGVAQAVHWTALYYVFPALTGEIAKGIGSSPEIVQVLFSFSLFVCACCSPFTAALFRRHSPRSVLAIANVLSLIPLLLLGGATALTPAIFAAFLMGLLMSVLLYDGAFVAVSGFDVTTRTRAIGWIVTGGGVATIVAIPILNLAAHHVGWRFALLAISFSSALLVPFARRVRWPDHSANHIHSMPRPRLLISRPEIWAFGLAFGMTNAALVGVLSVLLYFVTLHGFSAAQGAWVVATWGIASMPVRLLISMRQYSGLTVANVALGCGLLGFLVFLHSGKISAAIGLVMFGACAGLLTASRALVTNEFILDWPFESSNGLMATFSNCLRFIGPVIAARIVYSIAKPSFFLIGSALTVLAASVLLKSYLRGSLGAERRTMSHKSRLARSAEVSDAKRIAEIYNQGIDSRLATFETKHRTEADVRSWFGKRYPIVVVEENSKVVAFASASEYRPRDCYSGVAEFSVYVDQTVHRGGLGSMALKALITSAESAHFWKLISRVFVSNTASRELLRKLGFREVGVYERHAKLDSAWQDVVIVEFLLSEPAIS